MDEIERVRLQPAVEQVIDDELYVRDPFCLQKRTSGIEQALVYVRAYDLARGADPLAEDAKPAQGSAADIQGTPARSAANLRKELLPGGFPHLCLQLQALQLRG